MKTFLAFSVLLLAACSQQPPASFADRAARAEALENTPTGMAYVTQLLKQHGESINSFAGECYSKSELQKDTFKLVADIDRDGKVGDLTVQPETAPTLCYAQKIAQLKVEGPRPFGYRDKPFPIVINVNYNK